MKTLSLIALLTAFLLQPSSLTSQDGADLILHGGQIATVDAALGDGALGMVEAVAIRRDRIVAVGSDAAILERWRSPATRTIDLAGRFAMPGFIEGHGHFLGMGKAAQILNLATADSWDDVVEMVADAVSEVPPGTWIEGRGWHQEKWTKVPEPNVEGFPVHDAISGLTPDNPVSLTHASGHAAFFNAKAMELAGVTAETPDPSGGEILKTPDGRLSGVFRETAAGLVSRVRVAEEYRRPREKVVEDIEKLALLAAEECLRKGVTSFQDAGTPFSSIAVLRKMAERGDLPVRLWVMVRDNATRIENELVANRVVGAGQHHFTMQAVKLTIDGALGARGAWLLEPYSDEPQLEGLGRMEDLPRLAEICAATDFQFCVHGIGDRANREALDEFEAALKPFDDGKQRRWRVEHAQHLSPADIPRFAELGVIASMQGIHCTSDAPYVVARLGEERAREGAYAWRSLLDSGAVIVNGTDAPVEDVDPIPSYFASVTRETAAGWRFFPEQAMTREEALISYTRDAAYAAFEEHLKGTLTPGKLADIVVLSQNLLEVPEDRIRDTEVEMTLVGGKVLYRRND